MSEELRVAPAALQQCVREIFASVGIPAEQAEQVAAHLVEADMVGHSSHGVHRVPWYLEQIAGGQMRPFPEIQA